MYKESKKYKNSLKAGFTLVELLITISMFVIITGVVLVNSKSFDNSVLLHNFAYDVALTIKQAQSYGVNVKENISGSFDSPYGVYFDKSSTGSKTNFVLFNDYLTTPSDKASSTASVTTCSIDSECIQKYSMKKGTSILSLCAGTESSCDEIDRLSILFKRPSLEAWIYSFSSADGTISSRKDYAKIVLQAESGATSSVVVTSIGQIYIKK